MKIKGLWKYVYRCACGACGNEYIMLCNPCWKCGKINDMISLTEELKQTNIMLQFKWPFISFKTIYKHAGKQ